MRVFVDTNLWIYHLEGHSAFGSIASTRLAKLAADGDTVVISDLVRLECRVGPLKAKNSLLLAKYDGLFARPELLVTPLSPAVCDLAASLRADFGVKTPDALNIAGALEAGCAVFLTHDGRLRTPSKIIVETL